MKHILDSSTKTLTLTFPGDVVSTNADVLRKQTFDILESETVTVSDWTTLKLDLRASKMIDSMGLNLLVSVIKLARNRNSKVIGHVGNTNVHRALCFTRLNTQMELIAA